MASDLLDIQHLSPDPRQHGFDLAFRCFVMSAEYRVEARRRQRLTVDLAVGTQRQNVERNKRTWHHVLG
ncbi:hypothetical protein D3C78_1756000 [compost metagenome]